MTWPNAQLNETAWIVGADAVARIKRLSKILQLKKFQELADQASLSPFMWSKRKGYPSLPTFMHDRLLVDANTIRKISAHYSGLDGVNLEAFGLEATGFELDPTAFEESRVSTYHQAIDLVRSDRQFLGPAYDDIVKVLVPLRSTSSSRRQNGVGFSSPLALGAIFLSIPESDDFSVLELAINIAHEIGHQMLFVYQAADSIFASGADSPIYSGVRRVNRPAIQSLHAAVALAMMIAMLRFARNLERCRDPEAQSYISSRLEELRFDQAQGLIALAKANFTTLGKKIYSELCYELAEKS